MMIIALISFLAGAVLAVLALTAFIALMAFRFPEPWEDEADA